MIADRARLFWGLFAGAAIAIVAVANAHLVYVATSTQPACVSHAKAGDQSKQAQSYSAAASAC
jgi:hypothetical protein